MNPNKSDEFHDHEIEDHVYITKNGEGDLMVMRIEVFGKREQVIKLKSMITAAENSRISGESTVSLEEAEKRLE